MMDLFDKKDLCCGCGACSAICPKNAITIVEDQYGFLYPEIKSNLCVNCGKCKFVCNFQNPTQNNTLKEAYVAVTNNTEIFNSTSGGAFSSLAKCVLNENGVVYGCELAKENNKFIAKHISISEINFLQKLQGSKYIQSNMNNVYNLVQNDLLKEKFVSHQNK